MIQWQVRKKKRPVLMLILKGVYSRKKMRLLKSSAMFKCESKSSKVSITFLRHDKPGVYVL